MLQNAIDQHGFGFRTVERFTNDIIVPEQLCQVFFCYFHTVRVYVQIGIDFQKQRFQCIRFIHAEVLNKILLPVQVRDIYYVKINQMQVAYTNPGQRICNVGSKSAKAGNSHIPSGKKFLYFRSMTLIQCFVNLFMSQFLLSHDCQPPPTKLTISILSPSFTMVSA